MSPTFLLLVGLFSPVCDMDMDGDVDSADMSRVSLSRNTPYWEGSPADCNGDKLHTVADAPCCLNYCTRQSCAQ